MQKWFSFNITLKIQHIPTAVLLLVKNWIGRCFTFVLFQKPGNHNSKKATYQPNRAQLLCAGARVTSSSNFGTNLRNFLDKLRPMVAHVISIPRFSFHHLHFSSFLVFRSLLCTHQVMPECFSRLLHSKRGRTAARFLSVQSSCLLIFKWGNTAVFPSL